MIMLAILSLFTPSVWAADATLKFQVTNLRSAQGSVLVSVHNQRDAFPGDVSRAVRAVKLKPGRSGSAQTQFTGLEPGVYAISYFHDENDNGKLDTNGVGMPKEGFGFSRDPRISFGAPSFEDCAFELSAPGVSMRSTTKYF